MSTHFTIPRIGLLAGLLSAGLLAGCGGDSSSSSIAEPSQPARVQDTRTFTASETQAADFDGEGGVTGHADAQRWSGIRPNGASYRIEVPAAWNGRLVMYAHGYRGEGSELTVGNPSIRQWLLDNGYAWAASSYSTNFYDVRTGVEDTNELALAFTDITGLAETGSLRALSGPAEVGQDTVLPPGVEADRERDIEIHSETGAQRERG